ncbi:MAG: plasmid pRiA4b ORF-3 family protein [Bryobacterales bacterium]|nr:plasmid pRiA4b ORF-3 family protein [Bryobacterales bacterium]
MTDLTYQLKITIQGIRPPIWRRVRLPGSMSLEALHRVIQIVFGWTDSHLHEFRVGETSYGQADEPSELEMLDERRVSVADALGKKTKRFVYTYDFGDDWRHEVVVEKVEPAGPGEDRAVCLGGKRHGPPDDCGGPWGYVEFLEAIRDPRHEQHEEMVDWIGGEFNSEAFDLAAVNKRLAAVKAPRSKRERRP